MELQSCSLILDKNFDIKTNFHERFSKNNVVLCSGRHEQRKVPKKKKKTTVGRSTGRDGGIYILSYHLSQSVLHQGPGFGTVAFTPL